MKNRIRGLLLLLIHLHCSLGDFSPDFNKFLTETYGEDVQKQMERKDFINSGSFGGRRNKQETFKHQPVVIVHGVTNVAHRFNFVREYFYSRGYTPGEVFATTYGEGTNKWLVMVHIECKFVKQIRTFIEAVHRYTGRKVDILAYSMGSAVTRKALMGGDCQGTHIGAPLTEMVDTFVSVAGANFGSSLCFIPVVGICNLNNGLNCYSHFLKDLNARPYQYEGEHTFAIYSTADNKVGSICCGKKCSSLPHSDNEFEYPGLDHDDIMFRSVMLQYDLVTIQNGTTSWYDGLQKTDTMSTTIKTTTGSTNSTTTSLKTTSDFETKMTNDTTAEMMTTISQEREGDNFTTSSVSPTDIILNDTFNPILDKNSVRKSDSNTFA